MKKCLTVCLTLLGFAMLCARMAAADSSLNEMTGTIQTVDPDNHVIRLQTDNGFNVEFTYDRATVCKGIGVSKDVADLAYKDHVIIRYAGRDLIAREIEKRNVQPAIAASTPTPPTH